MRTRLLSPLVRKPAFTASAEAGTGRQIARLYSAGRTLHDNLPIQFDQIWDHSLVCPEMEIDCTYRKYGCPVKVEDFQKDLTDRPREQQDRGMLVRTLDREHSLEEQRECASSVQQQLQGLRCVLGADLSQKRLQGLRASVESLKEQVDESEALRTRLGMLEQTYQNHSQLLSLHKEQLRSNDKRFHHLESTSYNGNLIWKIPEYCQRKESGRPVSAPPFYTSRCGYKLSARAHLGGDGPGHGSHLSLYVLLMRGDFDSLLPWPFQQLVTLSVLDQSVARNHISMSFSPDTENSSFHRPRTDTNKASGYHLFVSHANLEAPKNAVYIRDDTLFIRVKVDTTGLEHL
ncbi:TNF receptor-associated factor 5 isoform X2 [Denticeps clupeoides]|uniref:TNF receptor-associated factor 5 isoform X2 n=1 Tax=Denticeps clupeoides TaxID=299321 RepID=UPI0010A3D91E|nr:TNF receptor-associated factor 5-like isoform X2 [Denticeps clupeoides]